MRKTFWLDVITPSKKFFSGEVEEVIINTPVGKEGRELGAAEDDWKIASAAGGFLDVKDNMIIYTDTIEWDKGPNRRRTRIISSSDRKK